MIYCAEAEFSSLSGVCLQFHHRDNATNAQDMYGPGRQTLVLLKSFIDNTNTFRE